MGIRNKAMNKLQIGDTVLCRYYNTPERKFYGDYFQAEILEIKKDNPKSYQVKRIDTGYTIWLHRKEIKGKFKALP